MVQIILIRPGATDYDDEQRIQGTLDIPLNALGDSEVARVIDDLSDRKIEAVYSPAREPANQTADTLAQALGIKHKKCDGLQNVNHGLWQGMKVEEVRRKHPKVYRQWQEQPESVCPPEGEITSGIGSAAPGSTAQTGRARNGVARAAADAVRNWRRVNGMAVALHKM